MYKRTQLDYKKSKTPKSSSNGDRNETRIIKLSQKSQFSKIFSKTEIDTYDHNNFTKNIYPYFSLNFSEVTSTFNAKFPHNWEIAENLALHVKKAPIVAYFIDLDRLSK